MKKCFKCGKTKKIDLFYRHKQMPDGYLNKCKECTKIDNTKTRNDNIEYYREYDRKRGSRQTPEYRKSWRNKNPIKYKAQTMVGNAIKGKKLFRMPCEVCGSGEKVHAHHDDYSKPLNIRWLCPVHHKKWHSENGEGLNGK